MAIDDRKKLNVFFNSLVEDLAREDINFHYPSDECFEGRCGFGGVGRSTRIARCNWMSLIELAKEFFANGPEVSNKWHWDAWKVGFDHPEDLHEMMVGIFLIDEVREYTGDRGYYNATVIEDIVQVTP